MWISRPIDAPLWTNRRLADLTQSAIAQRQADNRWGAYQLTDADGAVTVIFIPIGWRMYVSCRNTLYKVWPA